MKDELIKLLRRAEKDKPYPDELAEEIMELIDAQRCEWTWDSKNTGYKTACGKFYISFLRGDYCIGCGKRIEVKDGQE